MIAASHTGAERSRVRAMGGAADDRILLGTRVVAAVIIFFLLLAFGILYFFPERSDQLLVHSVRSGNARKIDSTLSTKRMLASSIRSR